jgi:hypothetical protein
MMAGNEIRQSNVATDPLQDKRPHSVVKIILTAHANDATYSQQNPLNPVGVIQDARLLRFASSSFIISARLAKRGS